MEPHFAPLSPTSTQANALEPSRQPGNFPLTEKNEPGFTKFQGTREVR